MSHIPDDDAELLNACEVQTYKGSGPGGQHRNKTESAVRLRHLPTDIVVQATERRSQGQNMGVALTRLRAALTVFYAPPPPPRKATRPSRGSVARRRTAKTQRATVKISRQRPKNDD